MATKYDEIVKKVMENPFDYEWELQGFGMLRTYIDKDTRLQIWLKEFIVPNVTDVHTHPWDFTSYIYQGRVTNYSFHESSTQRPYLDRYEEYDRCLILTGEKAFVHEKTKVFLQMCNTDIFTKGKIYKHRRDVPHRIRFTDGTITILTKSNIQEHNLAYSYVKGIDNEWVSAAPRPATKEEIQTFIDAASNMNKEIHPTIQDMFKQYREATNIFVVDKEAGTKVFNQLVDSFNKKYKIVPKRSTK